jgi:hypothetical protein
MNTGIYEELKTIARREDVTTYSAIAPLACLDMSNADHRQQIGEILGEISSAEHRAGRPLLSAVVILDGLNVPGKGFFTLARELGLYKPRKVHDDILFFADELRRVHGYWKNT